METSGPLKWNKPVCMETLGLLQEAPVSTFQVKTSQKRLRIWPCMNSHLSEFVDTSDQNNVNNCPSNYDCVHLVKITYGK